MATIEHYSHIPNGELTHKRNFLNVKETTRSSWYNRRRYGI